MTDYNPGLDPFTPVPTTGGLTRADATVQLQNMLRQMTYSSLQNTDNRLGGNLDPNESVVIKPPKVLLPNERQYIYYGSGIARSVCEIYPTEAPDPKWTFGKREYNATASTEAEALNQYLDDMASGPLMDVLRQASIEARIDGSCYLLLGVEDGYKSLADPIREDAIATLESVSILYWDEVTRPQPVYPNDPARELYTVELGHVDRQLEIGWTDHHVLVHQSRIIELAGDRLPGSMRRDHTADHVSVLQTMFNSFHKAMAALGHVGHMLANYTIFTYGVQGLNALRKSDDQDEMLQRFLSILLHKSVVGGICYDNALEEIDVKSGGGYGGAEQLVTVLLDAMIADTRMVRFKILGTANRAGLGAEGRGIQDRLEHASKLQAWAKSTWLPALRIIQKLALLAKDGPTSGTLPKEYGVTIPYKLELDPAEKAELVAKYVETYGKAIGYNVLTEPEARAALFGSDEFEYQPQPVLDDGWTDKLVKFWDKRDPLAEAEEQKRMEQEQAKAAIAAGKAPKPGTKPGGKPSAGRRADDATRAKLFLNWQGFRIGVQFLPFMMRHGRRLMSGYGYIEKHRSPYDGMAPDVYIGPKLVHPMTREENPRVYAVTQLVPDTGRVDEEKFVIGVMSAAEAQELYLAAMPQQFYGGVQEVDVTYIRNQAMNRADTAEKTPQYLTDEQWAGIARSVSNTDLMNAAIASIATIAA